MEDRKINYKSMILNILMLFTLFGESTMAHTQVPVIKHSYRMFTATTPMGLMVYAIDITDKNQVVFPDMEGMKPAYADGRPRELNPDFGIYSMPIPPSLNGKIEKMNQYLRNKELIGRMEQPNASYFFSYGLNNNSPVKSYSYGHSFKYNIKFDAKPKTKQELSQLSYDERAAIYINETHSDLALLTFSKERKLISTFKTSYDLKPTPEGIRFSVHLHNIGILPISVASPLSWQIIPEGERVDDFKNWMTVTLIGFYKNKPRSAIIPLTPEYLEPNTRSELGKSNMIEIPINGIKTINFLVPYKNIQFFARENENKNGNENGKNEWNEGENRTTQGYIHYDHAALFVHWYLNVQMSNYSNFVERYDNTTTQLKDWKNLE